MNPFLLAEIKDILLFFPCLCYSVGASKLAQQL